jgi:hypothetical protein
MTRRSAAVVIAYALVGAYWIEVRGAVLVPDTANYTHGGGCWSSPLSCVVGSTFGVPGLRTLGVAGVVAIAGLVARAVPWRVALIGIPVVPPDVWAIASGDALAAALAGLAIGRRGRFSLVPAALVSIVHLEAGLVVAAVELAGVARVPRWLTAWCASIGAVFALRLIDFGGGGGYPTQVQWRYLLPAVAAALVLAERSEVPTEPQASSGGAASPARWAWLHALDPAHEGATAAQSADGGARVTRPAPLALLLTDAVTVRPTTDDVPILSAPQNGEAAQLDTGRPLSDHRLYPGDADSGAS